MIESLDHRSESAPATAMRFTIRLGRIGNASGFTYEQLVTIAKLLAGKIPQTTMDEILIALDALEGK